MGSIASPCCRTRKVTTLAQHKFDAQLVPQFAKPRAQHRHQPMSLHKCKVTQQHSKVASECCAVTTGTSCGVPLLGLPVCCEAATAQIRFVHHVVMQQSELMEQFQSRSGPNQLRMAGLVKLGARRDVPPVAHGRPEPLATLLHKIIQPGRQVFGQHLGRMPVIELAPQPRQLVTLLAEQASNAGQGDSHVGAMPIGGP